MGSIDYGIQTLEYDSAANQMWCAVRPDKSSSSMYCLNREKMKLVKSGKKDGWDCPHAGDGLCSLGDDTYDVPSSAEEISDNFFWYFFHGAPCNIQGNMLNSML